MREGGKPSICSFRSHGLRDAEWRGGRGRQRGGRSSPARVVMDDQTRGVSTTESANREEVAAAERLFRKICLKRNLESSQVLLPHFAFASSMRVSLSNRLGESSLNPCPADICYLRLTLFERQVRLRKFTKVYNSYTILRHVAFLILLPPHTQLSAPLLHSIRSAYSTRQIIGVSTENVIKRKQPLKLFSDISPLKLT